MTGNFFGGWGWLADTGMALTSLITTTDSGHTLVFNAASASAALSCSIKWLLEL